MRVPDCVQRLEVEGESQRLGDKLVFDHGLDAPWTWTDVVIDDDRGQRVVRIANTTPHAGRLAGGLLVGGVSGVVTAVALADMSDGRIADYGPIYAVVFGSIGTAFGLFLTLTGWGPGRGADLGLCADR